MQRTRRGLLGAGVGVTAVLAGCLGVRGVEYPDAASTESPPGSDDGGDGPVDDTDDEPGVDPESVPNEALATATRSVVDDVVWFVTGYDEAVATYRAILADLLAVIRAVRRRVDEDGAVSVGLVDRVDDAVDAAADRAVDALEPYFRPEAQIRSRARRHVEVLRRFAPRNDVDRVLEELDRLRRQYAGMETETYVAEAFSRDPVHNRLLDRLLSPLPEDDDDRREVRGGAFVELSLANRRFATVAHEPYDDGRTPRIYGEPFDRDRREELRARMGPVPRSEDRTEELFVAFATRPSGSFSGWPYELDGTPVYVQRYPDAATASDRLDAVLADGSTEGRAPIDPDATAAGSDFSGTGSAGPPARWHRLYHDEASGERYGFDEHAGVQYGYVVQAGEFLLAAGFSGDAWEERAGWQGRLADGWVMA